MLLLLDSFTLWVQQRGPTKNNHLNQTISSSTKVTIDFQQGFYNCCLQNIIGNKYNVNTYINYISFNQFFFEILSRFSLVYIDTICGHVHL